MLGFIFTELRDYVGSRLGAAGWETLLQEAGLPPKNYVSYQQYPDEEVVLLVTTASRVTGLPAGALLEDYGTFIAPRLLKIYRPLIDPQWRTLDFIENAEATIHRVVRSRNAHANPPTLRCRRASSSELVVVYSSPRRLCAVARGIVKGVARHYGETVSVSEPACMLEGSASCQIQVRLEAAS